MYPAVRYNGCHVTPLDVKEFVCVCVCRGERERESECAGDDCWFVAGVDCLDESVVPGAEGECRLGASHDVNIQKFVFLVLETQINLLVSQRL